MRRTATVILALAAASPLFASPLRAVRGELGTEPVPHAPWIQRAVATEAQLVADAAAAEAVAARPVVLLETNFYTFEPGQKLQVRVTTDPNGWFGAATLYMYRQDRHSGEKSYYNIPAGQFLAAGQVADLFGAPSAPVPVVAPTLSDFVLFGSAADGTDEGWGLDGALGASITAPAETGLYQFVLEVRDGLGRRVMSRSNAMFAFVAATVDVSGAISSDTSWVATNAYKLNDFVLVQNATLTIEPGTVIYGGDSRASLFVTRGARIMADGTNLRPIVFTSPNLVGTRAQRDWGSLILLGNAPINEPGGQGFLEGLPSQSQYAFGGADPHDDSGVLRYVRFEFGGFEIEANQEINGLTLAGIGDATRIDHVQVLYNKDDAIEFFGGTANAKHLLLIAAADDGIDSDLGWQGKVQFAVIIDSSLNDENDSNVCFESDGHPNNFDLTPRTDPQIYNVTAIAPKAGDGVGLYGARLRRGTAGTMYNVIITGSEFAPVNIESTESQNLATSGGLVFDNSILFGNFEDSGFKSGTNPGFVRDFLFEQMLFNRNVDPMLAMGGWTLTKSLMPDVEPLPDSPALDMSFVKTPPDDAFFDTTVNCIGGVCPGDNWVLSGWAVFSDN